MESWFHLLIPLWIYLSSIFASHKLQQPLMQHTGGEAEAQWRDGRTHITVTLATAAAPILGNPEGGKGIAVQIG